MTVIYYTQHPVAAVAPGGRRAADVMTFGSDDDGADVIDGEGRRQEQSDLHQWESGSDGGMPGERDGGGRGAGGGGGGGEVLRPLFGSDDGLDGSRGLGSCSEGSRGSDGFGAFGFDVDKYTRYLVSL